MLRIRIRTQDNLRSLDVPLGGPDLPLPIRSLFDARDGSVGVQLTVGMRGFEGFAHESGAEAVSEQWVSGVQWGSNGETHEWTEAAGRSWHE